MKKNIFNMPKAVTIKGRSSSITNSFYNGIVPIIEPSDEEIRNALKTLEQTEDNVTCVYCGDPKTEWDHLYPLIVNKRHTGYITEIANLVPACGKCNQSKGNYNWKEWIVSDAEKSPKTRNIKDLGKRIKIIEKYDLTFPKKQIDVEALVGEDIWQKYQESYEKIILEMQKAQSIMDNIKSIIKGQNKTCPTEKKSRQSTSVSEDLQGSSVDNLDDLLNRVGKSIFVIYFDLFYKQLSNLEIIQEIKKENTFTEKSYASRVTIGSKIPL
ncbi:HNH endonuclease [Helicobacter sp. MIT 99-5507]|uniref:HNH endonuclease n=1 Tax=Helicobacter sp. MIT 99-5507 TaxID=152489 RepID=UPI000E1ED972|nr:HNH endonuclease [Helicobacter sp. MIT 99-5507]RDU58595.1 hypothetical protein CQA42_02070 [Helicobacter sp. MIT 99-5507]